MNFFKKIILAIFIFSQLANVEAIQYVSLGRDCQIAGVLSNLQLRTCAYSFDWMVSHNFNGIIEVIEDDFKYFLNPQYLLYNKHCVKNIYYQFEYNHFFPLVGEPFSEEVHVAGVVVPNFLDFLPYVQMVQNRRILRLENLLKSKEKVVFMRTHSNPKEVVDFISMIKKKYPRLNFLFVVIHEQQDLIGEWSIPHVMNVYAEKRSGFADWWSLEEWLNVFDQIRKKI